MKKTNLFSGLIVTAAILILLPISTVFAVPDYETSNLEIGSNYEERHFTGTCRESSALPRLNNGIFDRRG